MFRRKELIKGCAFDVGNTLINDTRLVQDTLEETANWLKKEKIIKQKQHFIATYSKINKFTFQPFISHTFGEEEFFQRTFEELGVKNISSKKILQKYQQFLMNRTRIDSNIIETFKFLRGKRIKTALLTNERVNRIEAFISLRDIFPFFQTNILKANGKRGMKNTNAFLVQRIKENSKLAFDQLYSKYFDKIYTLSQLSPIAY